MVDVKQMAGGTHYDGMVNTPVILSMYMCRTMPGFTIVALSSPARVCGINVALSLTAPELTCRSHHAWSYF